MTQTTNLDFRSDIYDGYSVKVLELLKDMDIGEVRRLDKTSANYERFVHYVKQIMDKRIDRSFGFEIEFNANYTALRKLPI
jgi:phage tail tube protein FII